jgi:TM2 domain-containing membrane protein YozV
MQHNWITAIATGVCLVLLLLLILGRPRFINKRSVTFKVHSTYLIVPWWMLGLALLLLIGLTFALALY